MKLKFEVNAREVALFKKIISDLKKISQNSDIYLTCEEGEVVFHNYYEFDPSSGLLFFMKLNPLAVFVEYLAESKKPGNQIAIKIRDEISKLNNAVSTIPENKVPLFFLVKEDDKRYLKLKHEIQSGISSVESKTEIEIIPELQSPLDVFNEKRLEIFVPLKSLIPFLEEGHALESAITFKIFNVDESASVSLKINSCGFKVDFSNLLVFHKNDGISLLSSFAKSIPDIGPSFTYTHMLSPKILKPLANACTLSEYGCLTLFNDNLLGITIQHVKKEEDEHVFKAQELFVIPELAVQDDN